MKFIKKKYFAKTSIISNRSKLYRTLNKHKGILFIVHVSQEIFFYILSKGKYCHVTVTWQRFIFLLIKIYIQKCKSWWVLLFFAFICYIINMLRAKAADKSTRQYQKNRVQSLLL